METDYYPGVIQAVPLKNSLLRSIILVFLILITGGLFFLVYYWLIPIQAFFYEKSHVSKSTHVKAFKSDSEAQIVPVVHSSLYEDSIEKNAAHSLQTYHIFTYKNESYVFDTINDCFVLISFNTQLKFEKVSQNGPRTIKY
jgi:P-type ATPase transporter.